MDKKDFWLLIKKAMIAGIPYITKELKLYGISYARQFQEILAELLYKLDTQAIAESIYEREIDYDEEMFLYARVGIIMLGEMFYNGVIFKGRVENVFKIIEQEELLYAAHEACPSLENYKTKFCYETYSNKNGWKSQKSYSENLVESLTA